ncbi:MAG: adventurous gliding motility protein CglE [Myxococcales bacterium]
MAVLATMLLPAASFAAVPAAGVQQEIRTGFFTDVNLGGFFTVGGKNSAGASRPSNAQPYLQLGIGYDVAKNFSLGASFGLGASASACFSEVDPKSGVCVGTDADGKKTTVADNFTATTFAAAALYKHYFNERFTLQPRLLLVYARLDPGLRPGATGGFLAGASVGVEYATHMDHFSIGADAAGQFVVGPNIFSVAIFPKVKYTF